MPGTGDSCAAPEEGDFTARADAGCLWEAILAFEGAIFYTAKGLEYSYTIRGNEMFVSRKEKSVTRASILVAYKKAQELGCVTGPKQLGVFGASYLYPVFLRLGIICASAG